MSRVFKGLAIAALLITVLGAGAVLYGLTAFEPQVEYAAVTATPALHAQETFDALLEQVQSGTFAGTQFSSAEGLAAEECTFLTYVVRLRNRGFFPAEWLNLAVVPRQDALGRDVLQLGDDGAYVLAQGSEGDMRATILRAGNAEDHSRELELTCYVFGKKVVVRTKAE